MNDLKSVDDSDLLTTTSLYREVEYSSNPTELCRYIEKKQFSEAIEHCIKYPEESATWIVKKDEYGAVRWRMLPVHTALMIHSGDALIKTLLDTYPDGAKEPDDQGMLAIHFAFRYSATESVINFILHIHPDGIYTKDLKGRYPIQLINEISKRRRISRFRVYAYSLIQNSDKNLKEQLAEATSVIFELTQELDVLKSNNSRLEEKNNLEIFDKVEDLEAKLKRMTENYEKAMALSNERKKKHVEEKAFLKTQVEIATEESESTFQMLQKTQDKFMTEIQSMKEENRNLRNENAAYIRRIDELVSNLDVLASTSLTEKMAVEASNEKYQKENEELKQKYDNLVALYEKEKDHESFLVQEKGIEENILHNRKQQEEEIHSPTSLSELEEKCMERQYPMQSLSPIPDYDDDISGMLELD